jgi:hypothetical protein
MSLPPRSQVSRAQSCGMLVTHSEKEKNFGQKLAISNIDVFSTIRKLTVSAIDYSLFAGRKKR